MVEYNFVSNLVHSFIGRHKLHDIDFDLFDHQSISTLPNRAFIFRSKKYKYKIVAVYVSTPFKNTLIRKKKMKKKNVYL